MLSQKPNIQKSNALAVRVGSEVVKSFVYFFHSDLRVEVKKVFMRGSVLFIVSCYVIERRVEVETNSSPITVGSRGHSSFNVPAPHL